MARNHEKNYGQLNRLWLQQESDKHRKPRRPRLSALNTAQEIWKWIPSIKEEIEFCLTQSQVPCYTNRKVTEYHKKLIELEAEYKSFLRKAKSLGSGAICTAGMKIPYTRRRKEKICNTPMPEFIPLPVLDEPGNEIIKNQSIEASEELKSSDLPLTFEMKSLENMQNDAKTDSIQSQVKFNVLGICYSSSDDET